MLEVDRERQASYVVSEIPCGVLQTALHMASGGAHVEAIRALKEVGFTAIDATVKDGAVRMMHSVCGEWCGRCGG